MGRSTPSIGGSVRQRIRSGRLRVVLDAGVDEHRAAVPEAAIAVVGLQK
ncbi:MAG TPA: hypothetical protein VIJ58_00430 [Candidatus Dormibacteraeota bacterium]